MRTDPETGKRQVGIHLVLPPDLDERVRESADFLDLPNSTWVSAVIDGALRTGSVDRLIGASKLPIRRRPRSRKWTSVGRGGYMRGDFVLHRRGYGGPVEADGAGWYLEGPDIDKPIYLGTTIRDARTEADIIVDRRMEKP